MSECIKMVYHSGIIQIYIIYKTQSKTQYFYKNNVEKEKTGKIVRKNKKTK